MVVHVAPCKHLVICRTGTGDGNTADNGGVGWLVYFGLALVVCVCGTGVRDDRLPGAPISWRACNDLLELVVIGCRLALTDGL